MKAYAYGAANVLRCEEIETPIPADDQVLIKISAASLNPFDYHLLRHPFMRHLLSIPSKAKITRAGRDVAGRVEGVGRNVMQFKAGDRVFGSCAGAFAEYVCTSQRALVMKPDGVSFEQAATVPIAGLTALQALRDKGRIQPGERVLINGAAGGVGTFTVQIAKSMGADVTGVCSTRNVDMVRSIGADHVIDYTREDFTKNGQRYDFMLDLVANHSFKALKGALNPKGMYIGAGMVGFKGSAMGLFMSQISQFVLSRFVSQKFVLFMAKLSKEDLTTLGDLIQTGKLIPVIDRTYPLSEVPAALDYLEEGHARGKVVITVDSAP